MHEKALPKNSVTLLEKIEKLPFPELKGWILAGGTGLALHLGHRLSEDFDFFRTDSIRIGNLHSVFREFCSYETLQEDSKTLTLMVSGIKVSFFCSVDPFLFDPRPYRFFSVADERDIALMKIAAIAGRGSRKDFVDLYTLLRRGYDLNDLFLLIPRKYGKGRANIYHLLKSLTYFDDAEKEPLPRMLEPFDWGECKNFFVRQAHSLILPIDLLFRSR